MTTTYMPGARRIHLSELEINGIYVGSAQLPSGTSYKLSGAEFSKVISRATVNLSDSKVSSLTIDLFDPKAKYLFAEGTGYFPLDAVVSWRPTGTVHTHYFIVTAREVVSAHQTRIVCLSRAIEWARRIKGPRVINGMTLDKAFLTLLDNKVSVLTTEPHAAPPNLSVKAAEGKGDPEDVWKATGRWSDEAKLGVRFIELGATGVFVIGRTSWLVPRMPSLAIDAANPADGIFEVTSARESLDAGGKAVARTDLEGKGPERTLSVLVHIDVAKKLYPGMVVSVASLGSMSSETYWVSEITGDLEDGPGWQVDLVTPEPDPTYAEDSATGGTTWSASAPGLLTAEDIARLLRSVGWPESTLTVAVALVLAESGGDPYAKNSAGNTPPSTDRGLWQFNSYWRKDVPDSCAFDPVCASKEALRSSKNGTDFSAWSAYKNGSYKGKMAQAAAGVLAANQPKVVSTTGGLIAGVGSTMVAVIKAAILQGGATGHNFGAYGGKSHITGEQLVYLGMGNHRLTVDAAAAWKAASNIYGKPIAITDSYRTKEMQEDVYARKPGLAAKPGTSRHERGNAIDVVDQGASVRSALTTVGWAQFNVVKEPWHYSYGGSPG